MKPCLATESFCLLAISPSCTHYRCTCFTCLPGALVSLRRSPDFLCLLAQLQEEEGGCSAAFYLIVAAHETCYVHARAHINQKNRPPPTYTLLVPPSWVRNAVCALRKWRWALGKTEAVRKKHPSGHQQPTPEYPPHISNTHIPSGCLQHISSPIQCVCVCVCVCAQWWRLWFAVRTWALSPPGTEKNDLFNTVREHLTWNLCETAPDRNTMENRGGRWQKSKERRGEERRGEERRKKRECVGPCWPALRRAVGLTEIWKVF